MNKFNLAKALVVTALPLSLAVTALAENRPTTQSNSNTLQDRGVTDSLAPGNVGREHPNNNPNADDRVARGMERSEPRAMMDDSRREGNQIIDDSAEVYRAFSKGPNPVPDSVARKAQCIAIIPDVITAAAVVGGAHGNGVAYCKTGGKWSNPDFVDLTSASLGLQLGAKSSDVVLFFTSPESVAQLKKGKFNITPEAGLVAGTFDKSYDPSGAGIVAYQRNQGAFVGASLDGVSLSHDEDSNRQFYGRNAQPSEILENRISSDRTNTLSSILPQG